MESRRNYEAFEVLAVNDVKKVAEDLIMYLRDDVVQDEDLYQDIVSRFDVILFKPRNAVQQCMGMLWVGDSHVGDSPCYLLL